MSNITQIVTDMSPHILTTTTLIPLTDFPKEIGQIAAIQQATLADTIQAHISQVEVTLTTIPVHMIQDHTLTLIPTATVHTPEDKAISEGLITTPTMTPSPTATKPITTIHPTKLPTEIGAQATTIQAMVDMEQPVANTPDHQEPTEVTTTTRILQEVSLLTLTFHHTQNQ